VHGEARSGGRRHGPTQRGARSCARGQPRRILLISLYRRLMNRSLAMSGAATGRPHGAGVEAPACPTHGDGRWTKMKSSHPQAPGAGPAVADWRRSIPADWRQGRGPVDLWHRGAEEGTSTAVEWRRTSSRHDVVPCAGRPSAGGYFNLPVTLVGNFVFG
jgi:hypothetical protein